MNRLVIDLGTARDNEIYRMYAWKYLYIGDCDGEVELRVDSRSASPLVPTEFNKVTDVKHSDYLYVTNTAQAGKKLVIYFEEIMRKWI